MRYQSLYLLVLPLIGLTACGTGRSADVKQSTIEQTYELTYNESTSQLHASASFHYENALGTSLKLTDGSTITFNGAPLEYNNPFNSASYDLEMQMLRPSTLPMEFRYVNNDGEVFVTEAHIPSPTVVRTPQEGELVRADRELAVVMEGAALERGDEITLCLKYTPTVSSAADPSVEECVYSTGSLRLVFSREQLARFPRGQELSLEVKRESHPAQSNARIHLLETYLAKPLFITLQ